MRDKTKDVAVRLAAAALGVGLLLQVSDALGALPEIRISQSQMRFSEKKILASLGQVVTFANNDSVTHNISVRSGAGGDTLDLGLQKPGVPVSHRFDQKGVYSVVCSIHPKMRLMVRVD